MLKKHKNAFFEAIQQAGLDPALFSLVQKPAGLSNLTSPYEPSLIIRLKISRRNRSILVRQPAVEFWVRQLSANFNVFNWRSTPFEPYATLSEWSKTTGFEQTLAAFKDWLENVAKNWIEDEEQPDYWIQAERYKSFVDESKSPPTSEGDKFTEAEKATAREAIQEFGRLLTEHFDPTPEQKEFINERLEYLSRAVDRLNRFDWKSLAFSTLVSISVNLSVDTERGKFLYHLFKQAFQATVKLLQ